MLPLGNSIRLEVTHQVSFYLICTLPHWTTIVSHVLITY